MRRPPDPNNWAPRVYMAPTAEEPKIPELSRGEAVRWGLVLVPVFALGAVLRLLRFIR